MANLIFDLDGTLMDTSASVKQGLAEACRTHNIEPVVPISEIQIGPPLHEIIDAILPQESRHLADSLKVNFIEAYDKKLCINCEPYPGALRAISRACSTSDLFVVTNKRRKPTLEILRHHKIYSKFKAVIGCDSLNGERQSKKHSIDHIIAHYNLNRDECFYFGDTQGDAIASKEAGVQFVYVPWGYGALSYGGHDDWIMHSWDEMDIFLDKTLSFASTNISAKGKIL